ncbi:MAG TPA: hypothetical protein VK635_02665, partial [Bradyrhizobium sp.]|nr:hypothetical protein [Bradyrhizobium sp.]
NSIFARDATAHVLAEYLLAEHSEHPQATQLIIAHSHGGNIALRALHLLQQRDSSQLCGGDSAIPLVVTLATPFVEVHPADFGWRPTLVRVALVLATLWLLNLSMVGTLEFLYLLLEKHPVVRFAIIIVIIVTFFCFVLLCWWGWWWLWRRTPARKKRVLALNDATQLGVLASTQRLLVMRAIDDEASLAMALGTIMNYLTAIGIVTSLFLVGGFFAVTSWAAILGGFLAVLSWADALFDAALFPVIIAWIVLSLLLFGMLVVSRSVHGRELAVSPMECQINTQSTPDAAGLSRVVTLVRRAYVGSLRHKIYDHEDCARAISDWVGSELARCL